LKIDQLNEFLQQVTQKMDAGDFQDALDLTRKIQGLGSHYIVSYTVSALLIDIGVALGNEEMTKEGAELLQKDFEAIVHDGRNAPNAYYNRANGYYALFRFKKRSDSFVVCFRKTELDQAKGYYRKALEYDLQNPMLASQILVNLGNCFDHLGRVIEAVECYEEALKLKPEHGMALGNKGIALFYYARLTGGHQGTFLMEANSLLSQALKVGVPPEAVNVFRKYMETIRKQFPDQKVLDKPAKYPGCRVKAKSKFERFLVEFCLKNKLYLNICNFCQKCNLAIGDPIHIQKMIVPMNKEGQKDLMEDDSFMRLSGYLNQIKQDYITARFLLVLSRYSGLNLNFVDKRVKIRNTLDYSMHNIYIELVKASFGNFYDILDKIACFINEYLELGMSKTEVHFQRVWYDKKTKTIYKKIVDTKNFSLNALFDVHRDFDEKDGPYKRLRSIRNALTHRFINIRMFQQLEDEENMTEDTLVSRTLELARLVRSAIIYLLYFVQSEESKKEAKTKGILAPMFAQELPDNLKSYR
jgi:hypothetical protein